MRNNGVAVMDWKRAMEKERAALGSIVAMLCALAVLAERASGRSPAVRSLVLWFLRQAEAVARDVVACGPDTPGASMPIAPAGAGPADAMRLAISLRALAGHLDSQARRLSAACRRIGGDPDAVPPSRMLACRMPASRMPALRDALAALSRLAAFVPGAPHPAHDTS
ncbi:hypothetical protein [Mesorhizobium sp. CAU 1732]|uniref:hypothetical protein n=1 Tax=Mesorhizobium sp. CAU 1732 TaxID=3140358 RepID=UPI0032610187